MTGQYSVYVGKELSHTSSDKGLALDYVEYARRHNPKSKVIYVLAPTGVTVLKVYGYLD